jgi:hypothetical protein
MHVNRLSELQTFDMSSGSFAKRLMLLSHLCQQWPETIATGVHIPSRMVLRPIYFERDDSSRFTCSKLHAVRMQQQGVQTGMYETEAHHSKFEMRKPVESSISSTLSCAIAAHYLAAVSRYPSLALLCFATLSNRKPLGPNLKDVYRRLSTTRIASYR